MKKSILRLLVKSVMATVVATSTLTGIASAQTTQSFKNDPMVVMGVNKLIYDNNKKDIMTNTIISVMPALSGAIFIEPNASGSAVVITLNSNEFKSDDIVTVYADSSLNNVLGSGLVYASKATTVINTKNKVYKVGDSLCITVKSEGKSESKPSKYVFTSNTDGSDNTSPVVTPSIHTINQAGLTSVISGSVVIGNKAYDLSYANDTTNMEQISKDIVDGGKVYVKDFAGNWIDNSTGNTIKASNIQID
ncbi:hypothetical protein K2F43_05945 [Clostridium estertheticum]|uniref:hypothetical protein n=1 Tax=Clostridium estertheticum TaxID=238834 RepID=UPI001C6DD4ED|nr:hypothetical protein [Clostridium estertheticum]MBW9170747.1 hypothetical protein [Clostridium estertheticum]WLC74413.1 hypothetical protein KTC99_16805 [Clostridium estertheticum]